MNEEYDFCVSLWFDEDEWFYSVIQEFDEDDTEVLLYGSHPVKATAVSILRATIVDLFTE